MIVWVGYYLAGARTCLYVHNIKYVGGWIETWYAPMYYAYTDTLYVYDYNICSIATVVDEIPFCHWNVGFYGLLSREHTHRIVLVGREKKRDGKWKTAVRVRAAAVKRLYCEKHTNVYCSMYTMYAYEIRTVLVIVVCVCVCVYTYNIHIYTYTVNSLWKLWYCFVLKLYIHEKNTHTPALTLKAFN